VVNGGRGKGFRDAIRKNRLGLSRRSLLADVTIDELRKELSLIDKTIEALIKLSGLRQPSRSGKGRRFR
jgi:hypothetical protein